MQGDIDEVPLYFLQEREVNSIKMRCTHFNIHFNKTRKFKYIYDELISLLSTKETKEVWCLVTNVARAIKYKATYISIPKHKDSYSGNEQGISHRRMVRTLDTFVNNGYLKFYKGGMNFKSMQGIQSIYKLEEKLLALWAGVDVSFVKEDAQYVTIRDRETKNVLSNQGRKGIKELTSTVQQYNEKLAQVELSDGENTACKQTFIRIYSDNLKLGGRFYNTTGAFQTISKEKRKMITIDQQETVEIDFSAMQPSILFEQVWQKYGDLVEEWIVNVHQGEFNPYPNESPFFRAVDPDESWIVRKLHKKAMIVALNAKTFQSAVMALANDWYGDQRSTNPKYPKLAFIDGATGKPAFPASQILLHLKQYNNPIADSFFCDKGLLLQNIESDIIGTAIDSILSKGETLIPIHDSIVVKRSFAEEAKLIMRESYKIVLGSDRFCKVV